MIQLLKDLKISKHTHFSLVVDYLHVLKERQGRAASRYAFKLLGADLSGFHMTGNVQIIEKQLDRKVCFSQADVIYLFFSRMRKK